MATNDAPRNRTATAGPSKSDLVRRAFETLGLDTPPAVVQRHVRTAFRVEVTTGLIGVIQAELARTRTRPARTAAGPTDKPRPTLAVRPPAGPEPHAEANRAPAPAAGSGDAAGKGSASGISLTDIEAVKQLARRHGAATLHRLIDLLAT